MPLISRLYNSMQAVRAALEADTELKAALGGQSWICQKLALHRGATWKPGAYLSTLTHQEPTHETQQDQLDYRVLAAIIDGQPEGSPTESLEASLARIERVEDIFRNKGADSAPASLRALVSSGAYAFQCVTIEPAERFVAGALALGYDCSATIVKVTLTVMRFDSKNLGA